MGGEGIQEGSGTRGAGEKRGDRCSESSLTVPPAAQPCCGAAPIPTAFPPLLPEQGKRECQTAPSCNQLGVLPRGKGAFGARILCQAGGWSRVRENPGDPGPSYPAVPPSKDRGSPPQGRPGVHSCCLLSWDRLALELLRPAPACGVLRNSIQPHTYSPHKVKGDKPGGD